MAADDNVINYLKHRIYLLRFWQDEFKLGLTCFKTFSQQNSEAVKAQKRLRTTDDESNGF